MTSIFGLLYELYVLVGSYVVEIIVDGVLGNVFEPDLVVEVRPGGFTGVAHLADFIATFHRLPRLYIHLAEMGISAHVVESVRNVDAIAVTAVPFSHCHGAVSGGIHRSPCVSGKVEAFMEFADSVNRVASVAVARSHLLHVFL